MARADLLKRLFESYQGRDDKGFRSAAEEIIGEERKKQHPVLANELQRIMANGTRRLEHAQGPGPAFDPVPMDSERRTPLLTIRAPDRYFNDLVLRQDARGSRGRSLLYHLTVAPFFANCIACHAKPD
jgi:hypothetical protein